MSEIKVYYTYKKNKSDHTSWGITTSNISKLNVTFVKIRLICTFFNEEFYNGIVISFFYDQ